MNEPRIIKPTAVCTNTWRPILWREWQKSQKNIWRLVMTFVIFFMIMPMDPNGVILLIASLVGGQFLGVVLGGSDVAEGTERYAFVLPLRRADYFWSRYWAGLVILVALVGAAYLMNTLDLHRYFWGMFCESGLSEKRMQEYPKDSIGNFILCGIFAYSCTYCFASSAKRPNLLIGSWVLGVLVSYAFPVILLCVVALINETSPQSSINGAPFVLLSAVIAAFVLVFCSQAYVGKSVDFKGEAQAGGFGPMKIIFIIIAVVILLNFLLYTTA